MGGRVASPPLPRPERPLQRRKGSSLPRGGNQPAVQQRRVCCVTKQLALQGSVPQRCAHDEQRECDQCGLHTAFPFTVHV